MLKPLFSKKNIIIINTVSIILLLLSILKINLLNRDEYVSSIYTTTPLYFWILISVNYLNGLISIYFGDKCKVKLLIKYGFIILLMTNIILFNLHIFENYTFLLLRGDSATYLGYVKDIILNGTFYDCIYPVLFCFISIWTILTNCDYLILMKIIPTAFYIIYFIFIYYWIKSISKNRRFIIYGMLMGLPLYFAWFTTSFYPEFLNILLLPLLLYLFIKELKNTKFSYIILIIFIINPLFHPLTTVFILIYRFIWIIYNYFSKKIDITTLIRIIFTTTILFVVFIIWNLNHMIILRSMGELIHNIILGFSDTTLNTSQYYISSLGFFNSIKILLIMNIDEIILYLLSLIAIIHLIKRNYYIKILSPILYLILGTFIYFILFITTKIHNPYRLLNTNFNILFCIPIISFYLFSRKKEKYLNKKFILLISFLFLTTTNSLYQSPSTTYPNDYATKNEIQGMKWLISNNYYNIKITSIQSRLIRYSHYLFGVNSNISLTLIDNWELAADHFNMTIYELNNKNIILFIPEIDYITYTTIWSFSGKFFNSDFIRIENNAEKIFDNKGLKIYLFHSK